MENLDITKISVAGFLKKANKGQSVRRCLFGPVDHEQNSRFLKQQLKIQEDECKARWNFDFNTMTPLSGKYNWEKVGENAEEEIPVVYAMPQLTAPSYYRARTPLGLSARLNSNVTKVPTKVFKTDSAKCCQSSLLKDERISPKAAEESLTISVNSSLSNSKTSAESTSSSSSVQIVKRPSLKRKLLQPEMTDYFPSKKRRSAFTSVSSKQ